MFVSGANKSMFASESPHLYFAACHFHSRPERGGGLDSTRLLRTSDLQVESQNAYNNQAEPFNNLSCQSWRLQQWSGIVVPRTYTPISAGSFTVLSSVILWPIVVYPFCNNSLLYSWSACL